MSATMIKEFKLPDLGEGLTESEILSWKVAVGDTVSLNQVIAEVETAKAVVELPSPFAGVVAALHEEPGTVVEVGKPIVSFEVDDAGAAQGAEAADAESPAGPAKREPNLVGYGAVVEHSGRPARRARAAAPAVAPRAEETAVGERPRSTPPVRKLARDLGVDLERVTGTGPHGLITREDVQNFAGAPAPDAQAPTAPVALDRETRTPVKGVRKFSAAAMVQSAFTAPHVTEFLTVDVTPTMELLARLKTNRAFDGVKLTPLTIAAKAVLIALRNNPTLNTHWDDEKQEIVQYHYVNLGIAAATPRGLTVPNIKDAEQLPLRELAVQLSELTDTARAGKTSPADLSGGTISITNIGVFGIDAGTPILNPGEAAIVALGAVRKAPWVVDDELVVRQVMSLSLSFDHRLVDGEQGSRFLADLGAILSDPAIVLTMV
ncbi:2-oxo acid dehydrogenase subunit E2 [Arthrobacter sp. TES]|uniref:dihydrolipoamide acetyltransferase family protein n=1 Tax=Paenarthrobacter TaxID=1742992 RepID=UPI0003967DB0|nr:MULTISPECIES: dihydrolipoamide acetyltransferase family protein [Paenarthrobacter]ERI37439.1 branched-chain alpha-keto acid dehydrogenase subunit E2 [Arthrobacter sp. AK-YN10]QOI63781.1 2-oxo acid dehydrogenase subunit E2 [Arthrobacter sp. TES]QSZ54629.1 branched-chain alpha-keto acid dehydrogenase subunit E2 [Paenarthrobacter ureafaciens]WOC62342.1 dihydrolipoamide acetyltransferase family protein [Paenarthrobacter sp. AT5]